MWVLATHPERIGGLVPRRCAGAAGQAVRPRRPARQHVQQRLCRGARAARPVLLALVWSFPLWLAIAAEAWAVTIAFGITMPFAGTFLLQSMLVIGVAVPTPGGVGSFHEAYRIGVTTFFGAPNDRRWPPRSSRTRSRSSPWCCWGIMFMAQDGLSFGGLRIWPVRRATRTEGRAPSR